MNKELKQQVVSELRNLFTESGIVIITQNNGLTAPDAKALRRNLRDKQSSFRIAKNSLVKIALQGTKCEDLTQLINGPVALVYSHDPVSAAQVINNFAKNNSKLKVSGGVMGEDKLTPPQVQELAELPSIDQLRSKLIGLLQAPATKIAAVIQAVPTKVVRVIDAYTKK